jgi:hypothetical protein
MKSRWPAFPADQIHVLHYRDLVELPEQTLAGVWDFLGIQSGPLEGNQRRALQ